MSPAARKILTYTTLVIHGLVDHGVDHGSFFADWEKRAVGYEYGDESDERVSITGYFL